MIDKRRCLQDIDLFRDLEPDEFEALAAISHAYSFQKGAVIAYQRDVADSLYIVCEGRLFAKRVDAHGIVRDSHAYVPRSDFGEAWLFAEDTHPATVRAGTDGHLLIINGEDFRDFLIEFPDAVSRLGLSSEAREAARKSSMVDSRRPVTWVRLMPDELIEYYARRTPYILLLSALPLAIISFGFLLVAAFMYWQEQTARVDWPVWAYGLLIIATAFFMLATIFQVVDWFNDYFLITNKQIIHREFDLFTFRVHTNKVPLDQVQSVEIARPNLVSTLLNVGTATITTAAFAGTIRFDYVDNPQLVKDIINELSQRVHALDAAREVETMRRSVEEHFNIAPAVNAIEEEEAAPVRRRRRGPSLLARVADAFRSRVEIGREIRYRKHIFVLLGETWWQILLLLLIVGVNVGALYSGLLSTQLCALTGVVGLPLAGWFIWRFEDWRNDTFQLTDIYVVDIDRRPFGFGESRKQAEIGNIQNVSAVRPSLWATIFNYGNVEIDVAGTDANLIFETVVNPDRIQSDIFARRERHQRRRRENEGQERRKELAILLDVYQQAREQERLPARTADPRAFDDEVFDEDEAPAGAPPPSPGRADADADDALLPDDLV